MGFAIGDYHCFEEGSFKASYILRNACKGFTYDVDGQWRFLNYRCLFNGSFHFTSRRVTTGGLGCRPLPDVARPPTHQDFS